MVGRRPPIPEPARPDRPQRNHRPAARPPAAAPGSLNADGEERRRAVCGRTACTDRWGARGNQVTVGHAARHLAPLAYPTTPGPESAPRTPDQPAQRMKVSGRTTTGVTLGHELEPDPRAQARSSRLTVIYL